MPAFSVQIPEELLPAITAEYLIVSSAGGTDAATAEEYFAGSIIETVRQRAEIYKVGPYFAGPQEPRFLQDGTPNPEYTGDDAIPIPPVVDPEDEGVEEVSEGEV